MNRTDNTTTENENFNTWWDRNHAEETDENDNAENFNAWWDRNFAEENNS